MSLKNTDPGASALNPVESPGRLIAAARESHSIGPADLAVRLRLDAKIVKALERDDFENLPEPTFVKGYIRSIAKELGIDAAPILEAYAAHASLDPPTLADFSSRAPEQVGINSTIIKAVTYVLAASLILLMALWWRSAYENNTAESARGAAPGAAADSAPATPLSYSYTTIEHDEPGWRVPSPKEPFSEVSETDPTAEQLEETEPAAPGDMPGRISITTTSEAWLEIYDGAGGRLYYGMAKADKAVEIAGQTYYRFVIGNSESVTLSFNGETVDLAPYSEEGVAQFELGSAAQSEPSAQ